jgi:hypothetical protein
VLLNDFEKKILVQARYLHMIAEKVTYKGWYWYTPNDQLPLSNRERELVSKSKYMELTTVLFASKKEAILFNSDLLNEQIRKTRKDNPTMSWRELEIPPLYWKREIT